MLVKNQVKGVKKVELFCSKLKDPFMLVPGVRLLIPLFLSLQCETFRLCVQTMYSLFRLDS